MPSPVDLTGCDALEPLSPIFQATGTFAVNDASFHPNHMTFRQKLPNTIVMALPGRRLGSLLDHPILARHPIRQAMINKVLYSEYLKATVVYLDATYLVRLTK